jgi:uncharacterized protein (DUF433 family)
VPQGSLAVGTPETSHDTVCRPGFCQLRTSVETTRAADLTDSDVVLDSGVEIRHYRFNRITLDPDKCFGKPCIRGLRMPVASILGYLASGMSVDDILRDWPELEREDIQQALAYASWAMEERVISLEPAGAV